jgi:putative intracellular protease/amidase
MKLAVVLTEGFSDWECALLMASARTYFSFEIVAATPGGTPVTSMGGLRVTPDMAAEKLDAGTFDGLILCGGTIWETSDAPDLSALIHAFHDKGRLVAAICGATLAIARSGLLNHVAHTSNAAEFLSSAGASYQGATHYHDVPHAVTDGWIVTAPGTAPITFTAAIYKALGFASDQLDYYIKLYGAEHQARTAP